MARARPQSRSGMLNVMRAIVDRLLSWRLPRRLPEFKAGAYYDEESDITEILLKDCFTVWCPLAPVGGKYAGHFVDVGYDADDNIVGVRIWGDVRDRRASRTICEGADLLKNFQPFKR